MATSIPENPSRKIQEYNEIMFIRLRDNLKRMILQQIFMLSFLIGLFFTLFIREFQSKPLSFLAIFGWLMESFFVSWIMGISFYIQAIYSLVYKIRYLRELKAKSPREISLTDNIDIILKTNIYHMGSKLKEDGPLQKTKTNYEYIEIFEKKNNNVLITMIVGIIAGFFIFLFFMPSHSLEFIIFKIIFLVFLIIALIVMLWNYWSEKKWLKIGLQIVKWEQKWTLSDSKDIDNYTFSDKSHNVTRDLDLLNKDINLLKNKSNAHTGDLIDE